MTTKKAIALFLLIVVGALTIAATKADKRTASNIERVMKRMKKPDKALKKMERMKLYTTSKFAAQVASLTREAKAMLKIKHPEVTVIG